MAGSSKSSEARQRQAIIDRAYMIFLTWQCEGCLVALGRARVEESAARRRSNFTQPTFTGHQQAHSDFQSALTFAGNVAKMLWPRGLRKNEERLARARGRRLRRLLQIRKRDSVLLHAPLVRNNFEHLDVRIDDWAEHTSGRIVLHSLAADRVVSGIPLRDRFTRYNPDSDIFYMLKNRISLKMLEERIQSIWVRAAVMYREIDTYLDGPEFHEPPQ